MSARDRNAAEVDLSSLSFWAKPPIERDLAFGHLRDHQPVSWHPPAEGGLMPPEEGDGYWAVVRHEDIITVSTDTGRFCSGQGVMFENAPEILLEATQSFLAMDAPRHTQLRKLVSSAFTPRRVALIEDQIAEQARRVVDDLVERDECDFVSTVAARLPMWTICEMMGLPPEEHERVAEAADVQVSGNDEAVRDGRDEMEVVTESIVELHEVAGELAAARRAQPADDLMTALVQAEVDGQSLSDEEICAFFNLLAVAGNDTTRNTISHSIKALSDRPEQRDYLLGDFGGRIATAIDEFVRWASPVQTFRRTATHDTTLREVPIAEGEKVVMFYPAGNRDERAFTDPHTFDVARSPNKHVGFGGGGPHFCMGNMLAKTQLRSIFDQLLHRAPNLELGEPDYLVSNFVHGVKSLPCRVGPGAG